MSDIITWNEFFMNVAMLAARRSKDPHTKVGACIVDSGKNIRSIGYNGMPTRCSEGDMSWSRDVNDTENKYKYIIHAELNAILHARTDIRECEIFTTLFPCNDCAKAIVQSGIAKVIYLNEFSSGSQFYDNSCYTKNSKDIFDSARVHYEAFSGVIVSADILTETGK